ncbi:Peptidase family M23 [Fibrobacter intestinalis]|uniref:Peptidase family M23 n=2 Tax=Fibrobacter intestinalis TaxID=28122 RepID=A0A1M6UQZ5_9BACT|nr:M23 family metallopeptidase [Fibrobacter intestinalis]SHK71574.1 Peptidase family M23 [Fibrobacter intestinalis]
MPIFRLSLFLCAAMLWGQDLLYMPFGKPGFLTSSFGENRGTRYHAGIDYSTEMQEGFPVLAPEEGKIVRVKVSPYFYGKVIYFQGKSGRTWVFAHLSGFSEPLHALIQKTQNQKRRNDVALENPKIPAFRYGDTLAFTGSSGIGNPHLHLELRAGENVLNPCRNGVFCGDTLEPLILGAAVFQGESISLSGESDLKAGCLAEPNPKNRQDPLRFAFKIADYSREPLENPMSIRRLTLKNGGKIIGETVHDTLSYSGMIQIREELLWAEEADTAGDWHWISEPYIPEANDSLTLEAEDMVGHVASRKLTLSKECPGEKPIRQGKNQRPELFTFLSRPWVGLHLCQSEDSKTAFFFFSRGELLADACKEVEPVATPLGKLLEIYPGIDEIRLVQNGKTDTIRIGEIPADAQNFQLETRWDGHSIRQQVTELADVPWTRILAVRKFQNDSVPAFEFHPKGLHFLGSWTVAFDAELAQVPLYYLGETSRKWFLFSKQKAAIRERSASMNELRDIGFILDKTPPELGTPRLDSAMIAGKRQKVLRIPVIETESGIENGNSIQASAKGKPFIYAEYDSEPKELVFVYSDLPSGKNFTIRIQDEAGNAKSFLVDIPRKTDSE